MSVEEARQHLDQVVAGDRDGRSRAADARVGLSRAAMDIRHDREPVARRPTRRSRPCRRRSRSEPIELDVEGLTPAQLVVVQEYIDALRGAATTDVQRCAPRCGARGRRHGRADRERLGDVSVFVDEVRDRRSHVGEALGDVVVLQQEPAARLARSMSARLAAGAAGQQDDVDPGVERGSSSARSPAIISQKLHVGLQLTRSERRPRSCCPEQGPPFSSSASKSGNGRPTAMAPRVVVADLEHLLSRRRRGTRAPPTSRASATTSTRTASRSASKTSAMSAAISSMVPEPSKHCQTIAPLSFSAQVCRYVVPAAIRPSTISRPTRPRRRPRGRGTKSPSISSGPDVGHRRGSSRQARLRSPGRGVARRPRPAPATRCLRPAWLPTRRRRRRASAARRGRRRWRPVARRRRLLRLGRRGRRRLGSGHERPRRDRVPARGHRSELAARRRCSRSYSASASASTVSAGSGTITCPVRVRGGGSARRPPACRPR